MRFVISSALTKQRRECFRGIEGLNPRNMTQSLELLAPAGDADIGIAAIDHGADAIYVGAPRFSARADAGVDAAGIERLIRHAHLYYARVYVALNTILTDEEVSEAADIARLVYELGADGLIIQDPGLLEAPLPPIPLIASTQMHNNTPDRIRFLEEVGFKRVILARELSLEEISSIRRETGIELECFVHGALCVSFSGQCYMSEAVAGRSGNRGVCAQPCRSRYTLIDGDGKEVLADRHLLSLKDLHLLACIPDLAAAGVTSFKIEGRYKEIDYVKNVTAAYSLALDAFIRSHPGYRRSSSGRSELTFDPDPVKTFNRGYTRYFISGSREKMASMDTPKSVGEPVGTVTAVGRSFFRTDGKGLNNGDGLCFLTGRRELAGFRVERVEGSNIYPSSMKDLAENIVLYRNFDARLNRILQKCSGRRRIDVAMAFTREGNAVCLTAVDEDGNEAQMRFDAPYARPRNGAAAREMIEKQLASAGNTPFRVTRMKVAPDAGFFSLSSLNRFRREVLAKLEETRSLNYPRAIAPLVPNSVPHPEKRLDFHANVLNQRARSFYRRHGAEVVEPAFEVLPERKGREVMTCRYCLRYELDACLKSAQGRLLKEPLRMRDAHHSYLLQFDCENCIMSIVFLGRRTC